MLKPFVLNHAIRLVSALALLVSVMISPIRSNVASSVSSPNHLRRNFGIPGKVSANHRPHIPIPSRVMQVKALSCESKLDCLTLPSLLTIAPSISTVSSSKSTHAVSAVGIHPGSHALRC